MCVPRPRLLPRPRSTDSSYIRAYAITGPPGSYAIQRVTASIRYLCGTHPIAAYAGTYLEYFRFAADGSLGHVADGRPLRDIHDLDLRRDGWCPEGLLRLIRAHDLRDADDRRCRRDGEARLESEKRYLLAPAEVEGIRPARRTPDGGAFGYLDEGPGSVRASLTLACCRGGEPRRVALSSPTPSAHPRAGTGRFTGTRGWQAVERYTYTFATQYGVLEAPGYVEANISPEEARWSSPTSP